MKIMTMINIDHVLVLRQWFLQQCKFGLHLQASWQTWRRIIIILIAITIITIIFVTADSIHSALITVTWTRLSHCSFDVYFLRWCRCLSFFGAMVIKMAPDTSPWFPKKFQNPHESNRCCKCNTHQLTSRSLALMFILLCLSEASLVCLFL